MSLRKMFITMFAATSSMAGMCTVAEQADAQVRARVRARTGTTYRPVTPSIGPSRNSIQRYYTPQTYRSYRMPQTYSNGYRGYSSSPYYGYPNGPIRQSQPYYGNGSGYQYPYNTYRYNQGYYYGSPSQLRGATIGGAIGNAVGGQSAAEFGAAIGAAAGSP